MQHWDTAGNEGESVPQGAMLGGGTGVSGLGPFSAWLSPESVPSTVEAPAVGVDAELPGGQECILRPGRWIGHSRFKGNVNRRKGRYNTDEA